MAHRHTQNTYTNKRNKFDFHKQVKASVKNRCYGWVPIQPSQPKQAIPLTSFDFNVMSSSAEEELSY